jgi:hypothetical protein
VAVNITAISGTPIIGRIETAIIGSQITKKHLCTRDVINMRWIIKIFNRNMAGSAIIYIGYNRGPHMLLMCTDTQRIVGKIIVQIPGRGIIQATAMAGIAGFRSIRTGMTFPATYPGITSSIVAAVTSFALQDIPV